MTGKWLIVNTPLVTTNSSCLTPSEQGVIHIAKTSYIKFDEMNHDGDVCFVLDQQLTEASTGRYVVLLGHITIHDAIMPSQPVFALIP